VSDLFPDMPVDAPVPGVRSTDRVDRAHAAPPGTGPEGETCGSCRYLGGKRMSRTWYKCVLRKKEWTSGSGTDVRKKDAACRLWEPSDE